MRSDSPGFGSEPFVRQPGAYAAASNERIGFDIQWLYGVLWKRKFLFFFIAVTAVVLGLLYVFKTPPQYVASVTLKIEERKKVFEQERYTAFEIINRSFYGAQLELLKSRKMVQDVITHLKLDQSPEFTNKSDTLFKKLLSFFLGKRPTISDPDKQMTRLTNRYLKYLDVTPNRKSNQLITLRYFSKNPEFAALVANTHAEIYTHFGANSNTKYTNDIIHNFELQLKNIDQDIEKAEQEFLTFQKEHDTIGIYANTREKESISNYEDQYQNLWKEYIAAKNQFNQTKTNYEIFFEEGHTGDTDYIKEKILNSPEMKNLSYKRNQLMIAWSLIKEKYLENHPDYIDIQNQLQMVDRSIKEESANIVAQAKREYDKSASYLQILTTQLNQMKDGNIQKKVLWNKYKDLEQAWDQLIKEKASLLHSLQKARGSLNAQKETPNRTYEILDYAEVPIRPINRNWLQIITLLLVFAFSAAIVSVLFVEYMTGGMNYFTQPTQRIKELPVLGSLPQFPDDEIAAMKERIDFSSSSPIGETFISLRSRFLYSDALSQPQTALFTSATENEGKSLIAANLAASVALTGKKTAILDCDLNRPSLHTYFDRDPEPGLTDVIQGRHTLETVTVETYIPGLYYIPAGARNHWPNDLFNSQAFDECLETLKREFEYIFVDTSPVFSTQSPSLLSRKMDGTFLVVRSGKITNDEMLLAADHIARAGGQVTAVIMNGASAYHGFAIQQTSSPSREDTLPEMT